jgi:cell division protease FtsH
MSAEQTSRKLARPSPDAGPGSPSGRPKLSRWSASALLAALAIVGFLMLRSVTTAPTPQSFTYTNFVAEVSSGQVATASISSAGHVSGTLHGGAKYVSQIPTAVPEDALGPLLAKEKVQVTATVPSSSSVWNVVWTLLPILLILAVGLWMVRRARKHLTGGIMGFGASKAKLYDEDRPTTRFEDVAGYEGVKSEVREVVDFLKHPDRYKAAGAVGPRGVLMVGPPGTGKTLMARAVAGEAETPFLSLSGSSFVEMFVGVGASRVRDLFRDARKRAPSIIFIDEIDAIGGRRGGSIVSNDEREQTLNQLLAEMDGFDPATGVVVIAATNRVSNLDPALLRPGRFDRIVDITLPNRAERTAILAVHGEGKKLGSRVDLDVVSRGTPGFSGADLANLVNEAAINAVRADRTTLWAADFDQARDRILLGRRDAPNPLLPNEKHAVAVHEAGHALVALLAEHADPVAKVSILPAGQSLGVTHQLPVEERHLYPESYLLDSLMVRMGGRASELLVLGEASTGAANDLREATNLATKMVCE